MVKIMIDANLLKTAMKLLEKIIVKIADCAFGNFVKESYGYHSL